MHASPLPAAPEAVAAYLAELARDGKSVSTVKSALAAVQHYHREAGHPIDRSDRAIASVMAGIVRTASRPIRRAAALELAGLRALIARIDGEDVRSLRDRALLLVAFFGALRRSELIALDVDGNNVRGRSFVEVRPEGLLVHLTATKASAPTQTVAIPRRADELCATAALERYLAVAGIASGPLFRAVSKAGRLLARRLEASSVRHILKQRAGGVGVLAALLALRLHHQCGGRQRPRASHPTYQPPQVGRRAALLHSRR